MTDLETASEVIAAAVIKGDKTIEVVIYSTEGGTLSLPEATEDTEITVTFLNAQTKDVIIDGEDFLGKVYLTIPAVTNLYVNTPEGSVTVTDDSNVTNSYVDTKPTTFTVGADATVENIIVNGGNVDIYGSVTTVERGEENTDETTTVTVYGDAEMPDTEGDEEIISSQKMLGSGTSSDPYIIAYPAHINLIGTDYASNAYYALTADVDFGGIDENGDPIEANAWTPLNYTENYLDCFRGTLEGNGFRFKNVYINNTGSENTGVFARTFGGKFYNLSIDGIIIGAKNTGSILGYSTSSTFTNCYSEATVTGTQYVGGIIGYAGNATKVYTNCYNAGTVTATSTYVGGVVGQFDNTNQYSSKLVNCYNIGTVQNTSANYAGGVVGGVNSYASLEGCYNAGTVTGKSYVGGVCAYMNTGSTVDGCYNAEAGTVYGSGSDIGGVLGGMNSTCTAKNSYNDGKVEGAVSYTGGVVGYANSTATFENCWNNNSVLGKSSTGGVVGYTNSSPTFTACYNKGTVEGTSTKTGGVVGDGSSISTFEGCYNIGTVSSSTTYVGGVAGDIGKSSIVNNCYNNGTVKGTGYVAGIAAEIDDETYITGCYNGAEGYVSGTSNYVAGVCGKFDDGCVINMCYNAKGGTVTNSSTYTAGVAGYVDAGSTIVINCYNEGTVSGSGSYKGGVVGWANFTSGESVIANCYNSADIADGSASYTGGVVGYWKGTYGVLTNCFNTGVISTGKSILGYDGGTTASNNYTLEDVASGTTEVLSGLSLTKDYMQSDEFVTLLYGNVATFNESAAVAALKWQAVSGDYPTYVE